MNNIAEPQLCGELTFRGAKQCNNLANYVQRGRVVVCLTVAAYSVATEVALDPVGGEWGGEGDGTVRDTAGKISVCVCVCVCGGGYSLGMQPTIPQHTPAIVSLEVRHSIVCSPCCECSVKQTVLCAHVLRIGAYGINAVQQLYASVRTVSMQYNNFMKYAQCSCLGFCLAALDDHGCLCYAQRNAPPIQQLPSMSCVAYIMNATATSQAGLYAR